MKKSHTHVTEEDQPMDEGVDTMDTIASEVKTEKRGIYVVYGVLVLLGVVTGYLLSKSSVGTGKSTTSKTDTAAAASAKIYKDSAIGVIEKGGFEGEGTHKLVREGGPSQTAYLTSTAVGLDDYVGKKVKVWGETVAAKKAAWLMDVGKVELQ